MSPKFLAAILTGALCLVSPALEIRDYQPARHDRFQNFDIAPAENPTNLFSHLDLSGVGWLAAAPDLQFALVSRQHVLFATHFVQGSQVIRFLAENGSIVSRTYTAATVIIDGGQPSDLSLLTLNEPIAAGAGVSPLPYADLSSYKGQGLAVFGKTLKTGKGTIAQVESAPRAVNDTGFSLSPTRFMRFDYRKLIGGGDDSHLQVGDSGSPSLVETGGRAAVVGVHSYIEPTTTTIRNFDVFVPHYVPALDALMSAGGYRMRPVNAPATTLSQSLAPLETNPRQGKPLTLQFFLSHTGPAATGNLEVEFAFAPGQAPDLIDAAGWAHYGSGSERTLRKALLPSGEQEIISLVWSAVPAVESLEPTIVRRSDTTEEATLTPEIALGPSFAGFVAGLSATGETDDPDNDGVSNLLEYALGGDPGTASLTSVSGLPLLPRLVRDGSALVFSHPERTDSASRGLVYVVEFSPDLGHTPWSANLPAGATTFLEPLATDGFAKRVATLPPDSGSGFLRLRVELEE